MKNKAVTMIVNLALATSLILILINIYGLTQSLRPEHFTEDQLRFGNADINLSLQEYLIGIERLPNESALAYSERLTGVIADGTAHIHWSRYDPRKFNQLVPIWENWILFAMGKITGIPEYQRYHFSDPMKSIQRGIGVCGEVSMVMEQLLERNGIPAEIISFRGHVVVTAKPEGTPIIFDPDFGVVLPYSVEQLAGSIDDVTSYYSDAGYTPQDARFFEQSYTGGYSVWAGANHFITKKFYFEKFSYIAKWIIPIIGFFMCIWIRQRANQLELK
jgi:hypothetical protein